MLCRKLWNAYESSSLLFSSKLGSLEFSRLLRLQSGFLFLCMEFRGQDGMGGKGLKKV